MALRPSVSVWFALKKAHSTLSGTFGTFTRLGFGWWHGPESAQRNYIFKFRMVRAAKFTKRAELALFCLIFVRFECQHGREGASLCGSKGMLGALVNISCAGRRACGEGKFWESASR